MTEGQAFGLARSLRAISRSTASCTKAVRVSSSRRTESIRANVPFGNLPGITSKFSLGLPMRDGVADISGADNLISPIDGISDICYIADIKYRSNPMWKIEWTPTDKVEAAARAAGMREGDGTSLWDWVEPEDFTVKEYAARFEDAERRARDRLDLDCFGEVRLSATLNVQRRDGPREEVEEAVWNVHADDPPLDFMTPDYRPELDLDDGDELVP